MTTTTAIRIHETGAPEVLRPEAIPLPDPAPGEIQIRQQAIGVNFLEVNFRRGLYDAPLPHVPGNEGAGVVTALGDGVTGIAVGDRVAYAGPSGSYAAARVLPADRAVPLPDDIDAETAAATLFKGLTAWYLLHRTCPVGPGTRLLFHGAAGGLGLIFCQWARALGAEVIGTAGGPEKCALAAAHGCAHVIDYRNTDFVARVREITGGAGVDVVYDPVGRDTYPGSLEVLRRRGLWVLFGQASGAPPALEMAELGRRGSLFATRPTLADHIADRADLMEGAAALFAALRAGRIRPVIGARYPLAEAARAHADLEGRRTTGSLILSP